MTAEAMSAPPMPLTNGMRAACGIFGASRSASIHMLIAVKCAGMINSTNRVDGVLTTGSNATTIGSSRIPLRLTAIAISIGGPPVDSAMRMITWAGAAHTSIVDTASQSDGNPRSCASAPRLI